MATWPGETPGASCGLYRRWGLGSQARRSAQAWDDGGRVGQDPSQTLLLSTHFAFLGVAIADFALGSGVCAGDRRGLGEVLFHPTWFQLFGTVLLTRLNDIVPYIYII